MNIIRSILRLALLKYTLIKSWRCFVTQSFYVFISLINDFALPFQRYWYMSSVFAASCINILIELLNYSRFNFFPWNGVAFLYLGILVNNFSNLLFLTIRKPTATICWWSLFFVLKKGFKTWLLALDIVGSNILDSIISRIREYHLHLDCL